jgi:enoyl-CoA hydratase/carnithine racemase
MMAAAFMSTASKLELVAVSTPRPFVAHVQLNRPDKMNSLNLKLWR